MKRKNLNYSAKEIALLVILLILIFVLGGGFFTVLWNLVLPSVFNLPILEYWQGILLFFLLNLVGGLFRNS